MILSLLKHPKSAAEVTKELIQNIDERDHVARIERAVKDQMRLAYEARLVEINWMIGPPLTSYELSFSD
jgi:hypothetical protein